MNRLILAAAAALTLATGGIAQAAPVLLTTDVGYAGPGLDLSGYDTGNYNFTFGPVAVGEFTFTANIPNSNSGQGAVVGQGNYGLGGNGFFGGDAVYIGVDGPAGWGQVLGATAYSAIGFYFNYFTPAFAEAPYIATLDVNGDVMDTYLLEDLAPISTPGGFNEFAFRGVQHDSADIYGLRFGGSYILASGSASGVIPGVPEPATWAMMLMGFGSLGAVLRRRRTVAAA